MTEKDKADDTFMILQLWRDALKKGLCIKEFHIQDDGKTFEFDLKKESEYNCDDCKAEFCFKSLDWKNDCENIPNNKINSNTKDIEYERAYT